VLKKAIVLLLLLAGLAAPVWAEPDETSGFLINDSVSMLDFGLYRLENAVNALRQELFIKFEPPYSSFVDYSWDENRIVIVLSYGNPGNPPIKEIKADIKTVVAALKKKFGVKPNGQPLQQGGSSTVADFFVHKGFNRKSMPPDMRQKIDRLVEIKVVFYVQNYSRYFECRNRLVGDSSDKIVCTGYLP